MNNIVKDKEPIIYYMISEIDLKKTIDQAVEKAFSKLQDQITDQSKDRYFTIDETSKILHKSPQTLRRYKANGYLVPIQLGKTSVYPKSLLIKKIFRGNDFDETQFLNS